MSAAHLPTWLLGAARRVGVDPRLPPFEFGRSSVRCGRGSCSNASRMRHIARAALFGLVRKEAASCNIGAARTNARRK
jgi:hypothetical protein